jgi:hypothetical protein
MWFKDLSGEKILREAIRLNMLYTGIRLPAQSVSEQTPSIRNIHFENITCSSGESYAVELLGLPEMPINNITFKGINASTAKGINISDANNVYISGSVFDAGLTPIVSFTDAENITIDSVSFTGKTTEIIKVNGNKCRDIRLRKSGLKKNGSALIIDPSVPKSAVIIEE